MRQSAMGGDYEVMRPVLSARCMCTMQPFVIIILHEYGVTEASCMWGARGRRPAER